VTWRVAVGDTVEINQPLVEIETAKSLVELPCPYDGVVTQLLAAEGQTIEVGVAIVEIDVDPTGEAAPESEADSGGDIAAAALAAPIADSGSDSGAKAPGPASSGSTSTNSDDDSGSGAVLVGYGVKPGSAQRRPRKGDAVEPIGGDGDDGAYPVLAKPPVRKLARELGIDLTTVTPSGPGGIVTRGDVEQHAKATSARTLATYPGDDQPWLESGMNSPDGRSTRVPVKSVRKRTAEAMVISAFTAPHVTEFLTVDATETMELVARLKADRDFSDVRVTPLLIVAKALLLAVRRHPEVNA